MTAYFNHLNQNTFKILLVTGESDRPSSTENEWYDLVDPELEVGFRNAISVGNTAISMYLNLA